MAKDPVRVLVTGAAGILVTHTFISCFLFFRIRSHPLIFHVFCLSYQVSTPPFFLVFLYGFLPIVFMRVGGSIWSEDSIF